MKLITTDSTIISTRECDSGYVTKTYFNESVLIQGHDIFEIQDKLQAYLGVEVLELEDMPKDGKVRFSCLKYVTGGEIWFKVEFLVD